MTTTTTRVLDHFWVLALPGQTPQDKSRYLSQRQSWSRLAEAVRCKTPEAARELLRGNPELDPDNRSVVVCVQVEQAPGEVLRRLVPRWDLLQAGTAVRL